MKYPRFVSTRKVMDILRRNKINPRLILSQQEKALERLPNKTKKAIVAGLNADGLVAVRRSAKGRLIILSATDITVHKTYSFNRPEIVDKALASRGRKRKKK